MERCCGMNGQGGGEGESEEKIEEATEPRERETGRVSFMSRSATGASCLPGGCKTCSSFLFAFFIFKPLFVFFVPFCLRNLFR